MNLFRIAGATVMLLLLWPEPGRYGVESNLYKLNGTMQALGTLPPQSVVPYARSVSTVAAGLRSYPGDWRPLQVAGGASLTARDAARALLLFKRAAQLGERPEIDADIGIAEGLLNDAAAADTAFLRASWLSPAIGEQLDRMNHHGYMEKVRSLEQRLVKRDLSLSDLPPPP